VGDFTMPSLGADMEAGTITQWLVKPGDEVHRCDIVAVVETEKSTIEVEIFENGVVDELLVHEGEKVPVGTVLARVSAQAPETAPNRPATVPPGAAPPAPTVGLEDEDATPVLVAARFPAAQPTLSRSPSTPAPVVSPLVRHLAERLGVDLTTLSGSGLGGTVTRADVEQAARTTEVVVPRRDHGAGEERTRSSPFARNLAAELGVDVSALAGSGPGGAVVGSDVRLAAAHTTAEPTPVGAPLPTTVEDRRAAMRQAIAALMARSKREIPHYYLSTTIDLTTAAAWLEQVNLERSVTSRLVPAALFVKATALAVKHVPEMNGFMIDDAFATSEAVHVGVAISLRSGGVIAPALHDVDKLALDELMAGLKDLVGRARSGVLRSSEMSDPTITVTNLGDLGVDAVFGVIYPPQVALVGFGQVTERPWVHDGVLGVHPCVTATLSADHRVSDGHRGGRFLAEIDHLLQEPERL
jgi:pyruvate dehydrogenase E2 component (dihydrolipoamide acetyltransferase)